MTTLKARSITFAVAIPLCLLIVLVSEAMGQQPIKSNDSPWTVNTIASVIYFGAGMTNDCVSTGNLRELNPILRNSHGGINQGICFSANGAALGATILLQRKHPKMANWIRWIGGSVHFGAAAHNWRTQ